MEFGWPSKVISDNGDTLSLFDGDAASGDFPSRARSLLSKVAMDSETD